MSVAVNEDLPLARVQISGLAVLKIAKHCRESVPNLVTGQLLGLDVDDVLEVTDCFPFPGGNESADLNEEEGESFQLDMMRCLREINVDNNHVGWYQSTTYGAYQTIELLDTFLSYQESLKRCICLVYDPLQAAQGGLPLKAIQVKRVFIDQYRAAQAANEKLTMDKIRRNNISWHDIFEELPIQVTNSSLVTAVIRSLRSTSNAMDAHDVARLHVATHPALERNLEYMNDCIDDLMHEQQRVSNYFRAIDRQRAFISSWQQKRRMENVARKAAGEELLSEEIDPAMLKPIPEPSQLDRLLITNQIHAYADQMNAIGTQSLAKLQLTMGINS